ncbi:hypothetical protein TB2_007384 [Malus domestica]
MDSVHAPLLPRHNSNVASNSDASTSASMPGNLRVESSSVRVLEQTFEECGEYFASILGNQVLGKVKELDAGHGGVVAVEVENEIVDDTCNDVVLL